MRRQEENKNLSRKIPFALMMGFLCFSCSGSPSSSNSPAPTPSFEIYIEQEDDSFTLQTPNPLVVNRGEDAVFTLHMKNGFAFDSVQRKGQDVDVIYSMGDHSIATVTIPDVRYSAVYTLLTHVAEQSIYYHPNGGEYISGSNPLSPYEIPYSLKNRLRPNTEIGTDRIKRDGYLLTGWNTQPDGSGDRVGLGSRVTLEEGGMLNLYAMWEEETPASEFETQGIGNELKITKYLGNREKVVVPAKINGKEVTYIGTKAFHGSEKTVVLPPTIYSISPSAFYDSPIKELYFYDNIATINDEIFEFCDDFSTIYVNAYVAPRYGGHNLVSEVNLADKYDILILNKDRPKLLSFGGSGTYMSVNTNRFEETFTDSRVCINMAVNGWFNGVAQFEMMRAFMKEGDILLHTPETSSAFSFLYGIDMAPEINGFTYNKTRFYSCLESNYDLWSLVDFRDVDGLLTGFYEFNKARSRLAPTTYQDYKTTVNLYGQTYHPDMGYIDDRGNFAMAKPPKVGAKYAGEADIIVELVNTPAAYTRLNAMYDSFRAKGVDVYFSTAPINRDTLQMRLDDPEAFHTANAGNYLYFGRPEGIPDPDYPNLNTWISTFESEVRRCIDVDVILPLSDTIFESDDFFEPDYHLCDETSETYTWRLVNALKSKRGGKL